MTSALDMPEIMSYIYSKSWKLQFSASSSIIIIEDYYLQTFLHSLIIAVGYRVNSKKATMFRIWANRVLKEFIIKGYVIKSLNLLLFPSVLPIILASSI